MKTIKNKSKKMLYLMHIDWGWAKQRPHFIAEHLSERYEIIVGFKNNFRKGGLSKNDSSAKLVFKKFHVLPFSRFNYVSAINLFLAKIQLSRLVKKFDIIWVTHPSLYQYVRDSFKKETHLVYDCMDDALEFPDALGNDIKRKKLNELEASLVNRSNTIISSSLHLKSKLSERYDCGSKVKVINNALSMADDSQVRHVGNLPYSVEAFRKVNGLKILYIGTISSWFDFDMVIESLGHFDNITYVLIGPCEIETPKHDRLIILPPVEHSYVIELMKLADALIMPFHVNELVRSVNPVKLYEYIYSQKPSLVVSYGETEAFKDHVYLYRSRDELYGYLEILTSGSLNAKSSSIDALDFVKQNTWSVRADEIISLIEH